jgi:predicted HTH domain antitoxin
MSAETIKLELPEDLLRIAGVSKGAISSEIAKLIALELFREHRISLGRAAELCGVSVEEFMQFAAGREVPLHYTLEDLKHDRTTLSRMNL